MNAKKLVALVLSGTMLAGCGACSTAAAPATTEEAAASTAAATTEALDVNATAVGDIKLADTENLVEATTYEIIVRNLPLLCTLTVQRREITG